MLQYALFTIHTSATDPNDVLKTDCKGFRYSDYIGDGSTVQRNVALEL